MEGMSPVSKCPYLNELQWIVLFLGHFGIHKHLWKHSRSLREKEENCSIEPFYLTNQLQNFSFDVEELRKVENSLRTLFL